MSLRDLGRALRERRRARGRRGAEAPSAADAEALRGRAGDAAPEAPPANPLPATPSSVSSLAELDTAAAARLRELEAADAELHERVAALDPEQQRAVLAADPAVLVMAQVGSGKTTVLTQRVLVARRLDELPRARVAVLTFTRRAAAEIEERLEELSGSRIEARAAGPVGTFHSVACSLLRSAEDGARRGRSASFGILDAGARRALLEDIVERGGLRVCYRNRLDRRLEALAAGRSMTGAMRREDDVAELARRYEEEKLRADLFDFDDLVAAALEAVPALPESARPALVVVDELQDCDAVQLEFLAALVEAGARIFAVGDPRQVIYSWRGSRPEIFDEFRARFGARLLTLSRNYRSSAAILEVAACISGVWGQALEPTRGPGPRVRVHRFHDPVQEGQWLVPRLRELEEEGLDLEDIAVLYRTRDQAAPLREALLAAGVPFSERSGLQAADVPALRWLEALLRLAARPEDPEALRRCLADPRHGLLRPAELRKALGKGAGLEAVRRGLGALPESSARSEASALIEALATLAEDLESGRLPADPEALARRLELDRRLGPTRSSWEEDRLLARRRLGLLLDATGEGAGAAGRFRDAVDDAASGLELDLLRGVSSEGVRLMTLHASKGLEFAHVVLSGCNEGLLPLAATRRDRDEIAEERRLLFVGLTRARRSAELTWFSQPLGPSAEGRASSFLDLVPEALLERLDRPAAGASRAAAETGEGDRLAPGRRVRHPDYGEGRVVARSEGRIVCAFEGRGEKAFSEYFCPLEPVEG